MSGSGAARMAVFVALAVSRVGCAEDAVTLPESWNTLKHRSLSVDVFAAIAAPLDIVKPLSGLDGSPLSLDGSIDLTHAWWDRPSGTDIRDGAHVDVVRVPAEPCVLTLDRLFPAPGDPSADLLSTWDEQIAAAEGVRGDVVWQAGFARDASCGAAGDAALANPAPWGPAIVRAITRHRPAAIELLDGRTLGRDGGIALWATLARAVRQHDPSLIIAGGGFALEPSDPDAVGAAMPATLPIRVFIDAVADDDLPLDVLTFEVRAASPQAVQATALAVRAALDAAGLDDVGLALDGFQPASTAPGSLAAPGLQAWTPYDTTTANGQALASAQRGAFEMACRILLQDVPGLRWAISDRGGAPGPYFTAAGDPTPAFMARFPMRQIEGRSRVAAVGAPDVVTLAAVDTTGGRTLHVLIAAWDVSQGAGALDYDILVPAFVPPAIERIDYRHAELDADNDVLGSFFFSDLGQLRPDPASGDVRLHFHLPVPGVHYLEIEPPAPSP